SDNTLAWRYVPIYGWCTVLSPDGGLILNGESPAKLDSSGNLLWSLDQNVDTLGSPAVDRNGTIYIRGATWNIGSYIWSVDSTSLFAISANGTEYWHLLFDADDHTVGPVISPNGKLILRVNNELRAYDTAGNQIWAYPFDGYDSTNPIPAVALDGTVYISYTNSAPERVIAAINPDGTEKWTLPCEASPDYFTVGLDGRLFAFRTAYVGCYSLTGELLWENTDYRYLGGCRAIAPDGCLYVSTVTYSENEEPDRLVKFSPDGQVLTDEMIELPLGNLVNDLLIDSNGTVITSQRSNLTGEGFAEPTGIYAYSPDGQLLWTYPTQSRAGGLVLANDGTLYYHSDGYIYAIGD
ncbi:PQQ-binding-like beta-propeller repeat protein, partial [bacterium]|nr:PQQ-binding-like beta-propeller repeat protein [bacterium]